MSVVLDLIPQQLLNLPCGVLRLREKLGRELRGPQLKFDGEGKKAGFIFAWDTDKSCRCWGC